MPEAELKPSFEKELANLERVVNLLERGELPLETAIQEYERGYQSLKRCQEILAGAQKKIELLTGAREGAPESWRPLDEGSLATHPPDPQPL